MADDPSRADGLPRYVPRFDGLRALAVLLVILFHVERGEPGAETPLVPCGWIGVDLFFALSGFLITGILLDSEKSARGLRNFYARRVLRIFPLCYLVLALVFFVLPRFHPPELAYPPSEWPWYFLYLQNLASEMIAIGSVAPLHLAHTWSLAVEEQFYLVWPWLVLLLPRRALAVLLAALLVAAPLARFEFLSERPGSWRAYWLVYRNTLFHVDGLAVGGLLALLVRARWMSLPKLGGAGAVAAVLCLAPAVWVLERLARAGLDRYPYQPSDPRVAALLFTLLAIGFGGAVAAALGLRSRALDHVLANALLRYVGRISYGLYVWHFVVFQLAPWHSQLLSVAVSFALAALSWHAFEQPILRLKKRFPSS